MSDGASPEQWRARLAALVAEALAEQPTVDVVDALSCAADDLRRGRLPAPPPVVALQPPVPVLGVDACPAGWVGVLLQPDGRTTVHVSATVAALVEQVREVAAVTVVAIDIPIGLPDSTDRQADTLARRLLPGKGSSVFSTLTRSAYAAPTYAEARTLNLDATGGERSASAQAYALRAKILEVDAWVRDRPGADVIEVHPELSFAVLAGGPLMPGKKQPGGVTVRRAALATAGITAPAWYRGSGFGEDDLLDACAAAWSAVRRARGESACHPDPPEVFSDGWAAAIHV